MSKETRMRGVGKEYPEFRLENFDFEVPEGQITGFIGPNGAGKSTTIRILMGLVHQDQGDVSLLGLHMPSHQIEAKRQVGFVSEDMRLYKHATLEWHMNFIGSIYPGWDSSYADALVQRFDLTPHQRIKGLSHGQRVKASLLLVLARRPKLLILDEPTTGLDPIARREVLNEMMEAIADEERTILFSSHNTLDVEQISDHIAFIDRGKLIASRDKESFLEGWRRLSLELQPGLEFVAPGPIVSRQGSGRIVHITVDSFHSDLPRQYESAGATIRGVERLTLEEIFVTSIESNRKGIAA